MLYRLVQHDLLRSAIRLVTDLVADLALTALVQVAAAVGAALTTVNPLENQEPAR